jgi:DNA-binding protein YbaB
MKTLLKLIPIIILAAIANSCGPKMPSSAKNMVAIMEVKEPIEGVCDWKKVYAILPFPGNGQVAAICPKTKTEIEAMLAEKVSYLKEHSDFEGKGMVSNIISCEGKMVRCEIDNKTGVDELDKQIVAVFATLKDWTAATVDGQSVDSVDLTSFTIKDGKITLN